MTLNEDFPCSAPGYYFGGDSSPARQIHRATSFEGRIARSVETHDSDVMFTKLIEDNKRKGKPGPWEKYWWQPNEGVTLMGRMCVGLLTLREPAWPLLPLSAPLFACSYVYSVRLLRLSALGAGQRLPLNVLCRIPQERR